jgi:Zn-dependent M28 family amino/carboxypeptidase
MSMKKRLLGLVFAVVLTSTFGWAKDSAKPKGPDEDGTKPALARIAGEGMMDSHAFQYLTELSDDVGARVTGTAEAQKAIDWGLAKMKSIGLENARTEKWTLWKGWTRGKAEAELLAPLHHSLAIDAMGWTGSTPVGGVDAELVSANIFNLDDEIQNAARFRGKVVLMVVQGPLRKNFWTVFAQFGDFLRVLHQAGALAVIGGDLGFKSEGLHLTHTGIVGFATQFEIPVVSMAMEDQGQLERYLADGKTVRLHLDVQNKFTDGPQESANVVGEITGSEHPQEIVVVGAHLDSWDLSEGSTDDGTGVASVLAAADAVVKSGVRPRRTIRFVLFTGEEQGLLGSLAYMKLHSGELKNHVGAVVLDNGQGPIREFQLGGRNDLISAFTPFANSLLNLREIKVSDKMELESDTASFILSGLPGINLDQDSPDYKYTHHSAADALEAVRPEVLTQDATVMALTAFWLADRPERFASPWPAERTARMLRDNGAFEKLTSFGLWTFGDLGLEVKPAFN